MWTFAFNRRAHVTEPLLAKARMAVAERAVMVSTPGAIKAFMLKQLELLHLLDSGQYPQNFKPVLSSLRRLLGMSRAPARNNSFALEKPALHEQARRAVELLQIWRRGVAVIDEVDVVLHPLRSELNWPLGDRHAIDFSPYRWQLPWHLLHAVMVAQSAGNGSPLVYGGTGAPAETSVLERLREAVDRGGDDAMLQRVPHVALLSEAYYHSHLRPLLAEWAVLWMRRNGMHEITDEQALRCLAHGVTDASVQSALSDNKVKMLNLASDWLLYFLPHVLKKVSRVHFGLLREHEMASLRERGCLPRSRRFLAVPFVGKDTPSAASEYAHPDVAIGLSILAYRLEVLFFFVSSPAPLFPICGDPISPKCQK